MCDSDNDWVFTLYRLPMLEWVFFYRGQYKKGKEDGAWLGFNPDGTPWPYRTGIYKDGVRVDK